VTLEVTVFTDPACPFAFSAEPVRLRLAWHYGDQLRWRMRMIVLTLEPGEAEKLAQGAPTLQRRHGMPIDPAPYSRPASSEPACRAVVAARLHAPALEDALLRRLRAQSDTEQTVRDDARTSSKAVAADSTTGAPARVLNAGAAGSPLDVPSPRAFHRAGLCGTSVIVPAGEGTVLVDAVIAHVRGRLADFKVPQYVALRSKLLPRNPGGKVLKGQLREETDWGDPLR
jgi:acyl-CoA synthetase (AMP-forming)/AMP-acid ligase II